jgi:hypothetical protein
VVTASQRILPILVDFSTDLKANVDLKTRYEVKGFPWGIYTDADGKKLREMGERDAASIIEDIKAVSAKVTPRPTFWQPSPEQAREIGKKAKRAVAVFLPDPKADVLKWDAKLMKELGDRKGRFLWALDSGQPASLKKYEVETASMVVVLDPRTDEVLARIQVSEDDKAEVLNKALDEAAKLLKKK